MSECKDCHNEWQRSNAENRRAVTKKHRLKMRMLALEALGGFCVRCGITDYRVLHIDHIHGGGRAEKRAIGDQGIARRILAGAEGFQLLCANCHNIKTWYEDGPSAQSDQSGTLEP